MEPEKDWTIMIYMAGDNNLSADMAYALADIRETMKDKGNSLNLMVYYDGAAIDAPTIYCDFTDYENPAYCPAQSVKNVFKVENPRKSNGPDRNSAAVYSLMEFVNWCVNDTKVKIKDSKEFTETHKGRKAKKYALIFSGHSSAFLNMSLMVDAASNYYMKVPMLRWGLEQITTKDAPHENIPLLQQPIDILGFDSCQMGMAELAYEFREVSKVLVTSEGNLPSAGWSYGTILSKLICPESGKAMMDEKAVGKGFVEEFIKKQSYFLIGGISVDISALELGDGKIDAVVDNLNELGKILNEDLFGDNSKIYEELKNALQLAHLECQSYMFEQNVDLKDFCSILLKYVRNFSEATRLVTACENIIKAIDDCVLLCGFSGGDYQYSNGISAFFPWTYRSLQISRESYVNLSAAYEKDDDPDYVDKSPLKDWKIFIQKFTYETMRAPRCAITAEPRMEKMESHHYFYPSKNNGVANDPNIYNGFYGGNGKNTGVGNDKNIDDNKNTGIGNDKNTGIGNDKNTGIGNDKNTSVGNDKNTGVGNDKNLPFVINKNTGIGNDKNTGIGNDKNTGIGNDKGLQLFLLTQFKNIFTMWNSSGFTKPVVIPETEKKASDEPGNY